VFDVVDKGEVVARFYLDMHARDNKFKHAAMFHVAEGVAGETLPEACLACNFPEPRGDDPGLMLHDQVTTFFHEFGHLLHHLFGGAQRFARFSGIATEQDFVEVPSQMYEEWAWSHDVLKTFALHYRTGEPISADMVARMRAAEEYGKGLHVLQQMYYARLSLACYERDPRSLDVTREAMRLKAEMLPTPHAEGSYMHASFGHLHGYSAMYYTYMWSLVIAKDLFTRFEDDLMNTGTANEYRATILGPGGSKDAAELVRDFLGREYGFEAFESWLAR
jgi:thimet oligopeptidase